MFICLFVQKSFGPSEAVVEIPCEKCTFKFPNNCPACPVNLFVCCVMFMMCLNCWLWLYVWFVRSLVCVLFCFESVFVSFYLCVVCICASMCFGSIIIIIIFFWGLVVCLNNCCTIHTYIQTNIHIHTHIHITNNVYMSSVNGFVSIVIVLLWVDCLWYSCLFWIIVIVCDVCMCVFVFVYVFVWVYGCMGVWV